MLCPPMPILSSTALLLTRWSGLTPLGSIMVTTPLPASASLSVRDRVSGEDSARAELPSTELHTRLELTDRERERDLSRSSLDLKPDWWSRLVSSLRLPPHRLLLTLGEVDTETKQTLVNIYHYSLFQQIF